MASPAIRSKKPLTLSSSAQSLGERPKADARWRLPARRYLAPLAVLFAGVFLPATAQAIRVTLEPATPVPVGSPATLRASVTDAVGAVTYQWGTGDCTATTEQPCPPLPETTTPEFSYMYTGVGNFPVRVIVSDDVGRHGDQGVQAVHFPPTAVPPTHSRSIIFDAVRGRVWNVNRDSGTVTGTDAASMTAFVQTSVGKGPRSLALSPDGSSIWVAAQFSDRITILDADSGAEIGHVDMPYASQPYGIAFAPSGLAYVTLFATGALVEVEPATQSITRQVPLGPTPAGIAISHDSRIFVTRFISPNVLQDPTTASDHGVVWELQPGTLAASTIVLPFDQGVDPAAPDNEAGGRGVPNYLLSIVISPDGTQAWVMAKKDNTARGPQRDGMDQDQDHFVRAIFCVIDLATSTERLDQRIDVDNRSLPIDATFSPHGNYVFMAFQGSNFIGSFDAYAPSQFINGIDTNLPPLDENGAPIPGDHGGLAPDGVVLLPDGRLFVNAFLSRNVVAYDITGALTGEEALPATPIAKIAVGTETLSPEVLLGKQVFFNAADTRMSDDGYMSCATCHYDGLHDGRIWDFTNRGEGLRNTRMLRGIGGTGHGPVHWSANFDEIQDFERDIRESLAGSGFMPEDQWQLRQGQDGTYDSFGMSAVGVSPELDGLAAFFASMDEVQKSPFRNPDGSLTPDGLAGKEIFEKGPTLCTFCHGGPDYTDSAALMPEVALHDVGTILQTSGSRLGQPLMGLDTPSLKGLWQTPPYLHDGRAATLQEIFTVHNPDDRIGVTSHLSSTEIDQLASFLLQIDDVPFTTPTPPPPPPPRPPKGCSVGALGPGGPNFAALLGGLLLLALVRRRSCRSAGQA